MADKKFCIFRTEKIKSVNTMYARARHNNRDVVVPFTNDKTNIHISIDGRIPSQDMTYSQFLQSFDLKKHRKDAVVGGEMVFAYSPGAITPDKLRDWAKASIEFAANLAGGSDRIYDAVLHLDESTPHVHVLWAPVVTDHNGENRLAYNAIIDGPASLSRLQTAYAEKVQPFGLERGIAKDKNKAYHQDHKAWKKEQRAALDAEWNDIAREREHIAQNKAVLAAVNKLSQEDFDFRIKVAAATGAELTPEEPRKLRRQKSIDRDIERER